MHTGVFCTPEELESIRKDASSAQLAQMTAARFGPQLGESLQIRLHMKIHALAIEKGLPEIDGFYGMDDDGQFIGPG